jgi:hypothetical protein
LPDVRVETGEGALVRLTEAQLVTALEGLFGPDIEVGGPVEPDVPAGGLRQIGAARAAVSSWGVEQYEALALDVARQATAEGRGGWMSCTPAGANDTPCLEALLRRTARRAWRRPVTSEEVDRLLRLATLAIGELSGDVREGLAFALAAILQAPEFLYRVEIGRGEEAASGQRALAPEELATRLAFFLWDAPPDAALLEVAKTGGLDTESEIRAEAERMMASPRFREGMRAFFEDVYHLYELDALRKDPAEFVHFTAELGAEAREETLRFLEDLLLEREEDFREVFTAERTFVNRRLAALYDIRAPTREGYGRVRLERGGGRRGLLGQASFLMLNAHPASSSATLRGKFVREVFLCGAIPPPPAGVSTALPEPSGTAVTLRDRVAEHLQNPSCAGCHQLMDPIGLGLEQFDGVGRFRATEGGAPIDPSGELDGARFEDAWSLGQVLHDHPDVPRCIVRTLYRYAVSREETRGESELIDLLAARFTRAGHRLRPLVLDIVASPGFRQVKDPTR